MMYNLKISPSFEVFCMGDTDWFSILFISDEGSISPGGLI